MNDVLNQAALRLRQQISHFAVLTDTEWNALVPHLSIFTLKKHQNIAEQGVIDNQLALVLDGLFRQFYTRDGNEHTTYFFLKISWSVLT